MIKSLRRWINDLGFLRFIYNGNVTILTLHRVVDGSVGEFIANKNMCVSVDFLSKFIIEARNLGFDFISMEDLVDILEKKKKVKKKIVISLDDGYKDNYKLAFPLFTHFNVPFIVYLCTGFLNREVKLWWIFLEKSIENNNYIELDGVGYSIDNMDKKNKVFMKIRQDILNSKNIEKKINEVFLSRSLEWNSFSEKIFMDWSDVKEMKKSNLCTIGSHTVNHLALSKLPYNTVVEEIIKAKSEIELRLSCPVVHFAYPFGSKEEVANREVEIIKKLPIKTAVTTRRGNVYLRHSKNMHSLPRMTFNEDFNISDIGCVRKKVVVNL